MIPLRLALVIGTAAIPIYTASAEEVVAGDPWAIGYGGQVARDCPRWQVERQEVLAERGVLPRMKPGSNMLAMNGAFQKLYYEGQGAAEADRSRIQDFCRRVPAAAGSRWRRLARVLRRIK
jgi:hypothetical protein